MLTLWMESAGCADPGAAVAVARDPVQFLGSILRLEQNACEWNGSLDLRCYLNLLLLLGKGCFLDSVAMGKKGRILGLGTRQDNMLYKDSNLTERLTGRLAVWLDIPGCLL